jgi:hypothetical protein
MYGGWHSESTVSAATRGRQAAINQGGIRLVDGLMESRRARAAVADADDRQ